MGIDHLSLFFPMRMIPKNMGTNETSCQAVGGVLKMSQAKNNVNNGPMALRALALATGIRWIPSIQKLLDNPKIKNPLATKNGNEATMFCSGEFDFKTRESRNIARAPATPRTNISASVLTIFLAFWAYMFPRGTIAAARIISASPIRNVVNEGARTITAPVKIRRAPYICSFGIYSLRQTWKSKKLKNASDKARILMFPAEEY